MMTDKLTPETLRIVAASLDAVIGEGPMSEVVRGHADAWERTEAERTALLRVKEAAEDLCAIAIENADPEDVGAAWAHLGDELHALAAYKKEFGDG